MHEYEGLQFDHSNSGPEVLNTQAELEIVPQKQDNGWQKDADGLEMNGGYDGTVHSDPRKRYCCGLSRRAFWIVVVITVLLVIGAAVGGSVGSLNSRDSTSHVSSTISSSSSSSSTATATSSTTSSAAPFPTTGILALNCPGINNTQYVSKPASTSYTFHVNCQINFSGRQVKNLLTGSVNDCMDQCATLQDNKTGGCLAATWDANLTEFNTKAFGFSNCFLFDSINSQGAYTLDNTQASGSLIS